MIPMIALPRQEELKSQQYDELMSKMIEIGFPAEKIEFHLSRGIREENLLIEKLLKDQEKQFCSICQTQTNENFIDLAGCDDIFCKECLQLYVKIRIEEAEVLTMPCPNHECRNQVEEATIKLLVSDELFEKYKKFKNNDELSKNPYHRWCPQPDCIGYDIGDSEKNHLQCNVCKFEYCLYCQEAWHPNSKCKFESEKEMSKWAKLHGIKICPNCRRKVEKSVGCDHMTCAKCRYEWCWLCGEKYSYSHMQNCEVVRINKKNPKIDKILKLLAAPLMLPFICVILCCYCVYKILNEAGSEITRVFMKRHQILSYFLGIIFGVVLTPLFVSLSPFVIAIGTIGEFFYDKSGSKYCGCTLGVFLGILSAPLVVVGVVFFAFVMHFIGIALALWKVYISIRRCRDPMYLTPKVNYRF
jgi:hypothetical protein